MKKLILLMLVSFSFVFADDKFYVHFCVHTQLPTGQDRVFIFDYGLFEGNLVKDVTPYARPYEVVLPAHSGQIYCSESISVQVDNSFPHPEAKISFSVYGAQGTSPSIGGFGTLHITYYDHDVEGGYKRSYYLAKDRTMSVLICPKPLICYDSKNEENYEIDHLDNNNIYMMYDLDGSV